MASQLRKLGILKNYSILLIINIESDVLFVVENHLTNLLSYLSSGRVGLQNLTFGSWLKIDLMSLGDEFHVSHPSNVPGHPNNVTGQYETTLARPLNLPGIWEVALIDITYPHT